MSLSSVSCFRNQSVCEHPCQGRYRPALCTLQAKNPEVNEHRSEIGSRILLICICSFQMKDQELTLTTKVKKKKSSELQTLWFELLPAVVGQATTKYM